MAIIAGSASIARPAFYNTDIIYASGSILVKSPTHASPIIKSTNLHDTILSIEPIPGTSLMIITTGTHIFLYCAENHEFSSPIVAYSVLRIAIAPSADILYFLVLNKTDVLSSSLYSAKLTKGAAVDITEPKLLVNSIILRSPPTLSISANGDSALLCTGKMAYLVSNNIVYRLALKNYCTASCLRSDGKSIAFGMGSGQIRIFDISKLVSGLMVYNISDTEIQSNPLIPKQHESPALSITNWKTGVPCSISFGEAASKQLHFSDIVKDLSLSLDTLPTNGIISQSEIIESSALPCRSIIYHRYAVYGLEYTHKYIYPKSDIGSTRIPVKVAVKFDNNLMSCGAEGALMFWGEKNRVVPHLGRNLEVLAIGRSSRSPILSVTTGTNNISLVNYEEMRYTARIECLLMPAGIATSLAEASLSILTRAGIKATTAHRIKLGDVKKIFAAHPRNTILSEISDTHIGILQDISSVQIISSFGKLQTLQTESRELSWEDSKDARPWHSTSIATYKDLTAIIQSRDVDLGYRGFTPGIIRSFVLPSSEAILTTECPGTDKRILKESSFIFAGTDEKEKIPITTKSKNDSQKESNKKDKSKNDSNCLQGESKPAKRLYTSEFVESKRKGGTEKIAEKETWISQICRPPPRQNTRQVSRILLYVGNICRGILYSPCESPLVVAKPCEQGIISVSRSGELLCIDESLNKQPITNSLISQATLTDSVILGNDMVLAFTDAIQTWKCIDGIWQSSKILLVDSSSRIEKVSYLKKLNLILVSRKKELASRMEWEKEVRDGSHSIWEIILVDTLTGDYTILKHVTGKSCHISSFCTEYGSGIAFSSDSQNKIDIIHFASEFVQSRTGIEDNSIEVPTLASLLSWSTTKKSKLGDLFNNENHIVISLHAENCYGISIIKSELFFLTQPYSLHCWHLFTKPNTPELIPSPDIKKSISVTRLQSIKLVT